VSAELPPVAAGSILFVTLDSCRYDTFAAARAPNLKAIGPLHRAMAPSYFTYGSHAAMFVGFTPGVAEAREAFVNPKFGKLFRMEAKAFPGIAPPYLELSGSNIIDGLKRRGLRAIGTAATTWFNPKTATGKALTTDFEDFFFPGNLYSLPRQVAWAHERIAKAGRRPVLVFVNVGETHVPYYHEGAPWERLPSPCVPFSSGNDAAECRRRQAACLEFVDAQLGPLVQRFSREMMLVCADHGDCWGEDGLWEHGVHHEKTLEVPLLFRLPTDAL
jgi:hypothetical protein